MSTSGLERVFARWSQDEEFRRRFKGSPQQAIREEGFDLSAEEWSTLGDMNLAGLEDHHLKQRVSKSAFALSKLLGLGIDGAAVAPSSLEGGSLESTAIDSAMERGLESAGLTGGSLAGRSLEATSADGVGGSAAASLDATADNSAPEQQTEAGSATERP